MPVKIVFPRYVNEAIRLMLIIGVDPTNYNLARQECYNRGLGQAGTWMGDHPDTYTVGINQGYEVEQDHPAYVPPVKSVEPEPVVFMAEVDPTIQTHLEIGGEEQPEIPTEAWGTSGPTEEPPSPTDPVPETEIPAEIEAVPIVPTRPRRKK